MPAAARWRTYDETKPIEMMPGVIRRTLVSGDGHTLVRFELEAGAVVPLHTHPHEQAGTVIAGRIIFGIDGTDREVVAGGSYFVPGTVPHHARALEPSVMIEVFAPVREEYASD
ncbi:MAG: cupin domain-containing protein [Chloroflexi bacterium]|nr:cupin domain-containing protein [Chloroflexota bacterium]MDA1241049.1 cupin domain-containing protein [Chloroflexota bacterium]